MQLKETICIEKGKHVILSHVQNTSNDNDWSVPENVALAKNNSNEFSSKFSTDLTRFSFKFLETPSRVRFTLTLTGLRLFWRVFQ